MRKLVTLVALAAVALPIVGTSAAQAMSASSTAAAVTRVWSASVKNYLRAHHVGLQASNFSVRCYARGGGGYDCYGTDWEYNPAIGHSLKQGIRIRALPDHQWYTVGNARILTVR